MRVWKLAKTPVDRGGDLASNDLASDDRVPPGKDGRRDLCPPSRLRFPRARRAGATTVGERRAVTQRGSGDRQGEPWCEQAGTSSTAIEPQRRRRRKSAPRPMSVSRITWIMERKSGFNSADGSIVRSFWVSSGGTGAAPTFPRSLRYSPDGPACSAEGIPRFWISVWSAIQAAASEATRRAHMAPCTNCSALQFVTDVLRHTGAAEMIDRRT